MPLSAGSRLGHYEILSAIGAGGMGDVYRARDTRLDRTVAIKVIRMHDAAGEETRERFSREAKVISALDHPNICALYDVGHDAGLDYLVIQYLEGETLAQRLTHGPLAPIQSLQVAAEIARALDAAHRKNIVHRDLKPANVMLTKTGVKLLDFGIAKIASQPPIGTATMSATQTPSLTAEGVVVGTPYYMSPEQLEGRGVDGRSDLFSFGGILYEMLSGRRPFARESIASEVTAIMSAPAPTLSDVPDLKPSLPARTRRSLDRLLARCLAKERDERWQSASDLADELTWIDAERRRGDDAAEVGRTNSPPGWRIGAAAVAGALIALAAMAAPGVIWRRESSPPPRETQFLVDSPGETRFANVYEGIAAAPDGRSVLFTAAGDPGSRPALWLRSLDSLTARLLPGTEGADSPSWSPDGRSVVFFADGKLKRLDLSGGPPLALSDAIAAGNAIGGASENGDGVILFGSASGVQRVSRLGGDVSRVTAVDQSRSETAHVLPQFLPDGTRFLYFIASDDANVQGVYVATLDNPAQRTLVLRTPSKAMYVAPLHSHPAYLLWMRDRTLMAQPVDSGTLQPTGDPASVADEISVSIYNSRPAFAVSDAGLLTYFAGSTFSKRPIVWMRRTGKEPVTAAPEDVYWNLALARGGDRMAYSRWETGSDTGQANLDVWLWEFSRPAGTRLTFGPGRDGSIIWSPDGKQLAFSSVREGGVAQIYRRPAAGGDVQDERLTDGPGYKIADDWSQDGKYIIYSERGDIMAIALHGDRKPIAVVQTSSVEREGVISPDGRWIAFSANYSGRPEVYVKPFLNRENASQQVSRISTDGGSSSKWRGDGKELFYQDLDGDLMAVTIQAGPEGIRAGTPHELFAVSLRVPRSARQFDVTPDGERFLMILSPASERERQQLTVVSNWQTALARRAQ